MLVLSRKVGDAIIVGEAVSLRILEIRGKTVRVGIDAPAEIQVHREEVFARLQTTEQFQERVGQAVVAPAEQHRSQSPLDSSAAQVH
jgi:carbon storage regulator